MVIGFSFCLFCSASFHLLMVKSPEWSAILSRLDYGGISMAILGGNIPIIYYSFACEPMYNHRTLWVTIMSILCSGCFITSMLKKFDHPFYRPVRGFMFIFAGLSAIAVFVAILAKPSPYKMQIEWVWSAVAGYAFVQGAILYVLRVPERCKPGAFDLCGASHQLFHFAVLIGMGLFFWQDFKLFD